jgi:hypothetical protein
MNNSKKLTGTIIIFVFFLFAVSSFSQSKMKEYKDCTPEEKAMIIVENLTPVLNLDDTQSENLYNLYLDRIKWKSINEVAGTDNNKSLNRKKYVEFKTKLNDILTAEQIKNMKSYCDSKKMNR